MYRKEYNIKVDVRAQDMIRLWAPVDTIMNIRFP